MFETNLWSKSYGNPTSTTSAFCQLSELQINLAMTATLHKTKSVTKLRIKLRLPGTETKTSLTIMIIPISQLRLNLHGRYTSLSQRNYLSRWIMQAYYTTYFTERINIFINKINICSVGRRPLASASRHTMNEWRHEWMSLYLGLPGCKITLKYYKK